MKNHWDDKQAKVRKRRSWPIAGTIAACVLAGALALPLFAPNQPGPKTETERTTTPPLTQSATEAPSSSSDNLVLSDKPDAKPVITVAFGGEDGVVAEHKAGVVLAQIPDGIPLEEFNENIAQLDYLAPQTLTEEDLSLGWVELTVSDGVNLPDAMRLLETSGLVAATQPNYVYHLVETDIDAELQPGTINGDPPPNVTGTGNSHDANNYHHFVNDPEARNQGVTLTVQLAEACNYLKEKGCISEIGNSTSNDAILTWSRSNTTWNRSDESKRPTIAILDTGCDLNHEDLGGTDGNIVDYYDAVKKTKDGFHDIDTHGTHVAGIASAVTNNGAGITGVSLNAGLMPVNVFAWTNHDLGADSKDIAAGYEYVMNHAAEFNVRVVNLSLGADTETMDSDDKLFVQAVDKAYRKGILTVIASGNESNTFRGAYTDFPADFAPNAISVIDCAISGFDENPQSLSGMDLILSRDYYSNFNKEGTVAKQLSALGSFVESTIPGNSYDKKNGTSMASPCVAGVAALALQVNPDLTVEQLKSLLYSSADDVTRIMKGYVDEVAPGFDVYTGFGTVNAYKAVKAADTGAFLSVTEDGQTTIPVLAKGAAGASTVKFSAPAAEGAWQWSSSNPGVASVNNGLVTAIGPGQAIISANSGTGADATLLYTTVTVYGAQVSGSGSIPYGETTTLSVDEKPTNGTWRWASDDATVATVGEWSGVVTAKSPGSTTITATLSANPAISVSKTVTVDKIDFSNAVTVSMNGWTYDGTEHKPQVTVKWKANGQALESREFTVRGYTGNINAGTCKVTVAPTDATRYQGTAEGSCTVAQRSIARAVVSAIPSQTYTGKAQTPTPTITLDGKALANNTDFTLSYQNNVNAGTATVTATGTGNYCDTASARFTITSPPAPQAPDPDNSSSAENPVNSSPEPEPAPSVVPPVVEPVIEPAIEPNPTTLPEPMHRLYNPNSGEHFYTHDDGERDYLIEVGWRDEGEGWNSPVISSSPVYRLYNPYAGDHHYTLDEAERDYLASAGWNDEGIAWYSDDNHGAPLYRLYNPNAKTGSHHYTLDPNERDYLTDIGWHDEGISWYGLA